MHTKLAFCANFLVAIKYIRIDSMFMVLYCDESIFSVTSNAFTAQFMVRRKVRRNCIAYNLLRSFCTHKMRSDNPFVWWCTRNTSAACGCRILCSERKWMRSSSLDWLCLIIRIKQFGSIFRYLHFSQRKLVLFWGDKKILLLDYIHGY